uniref:Sirtuin 3 n=1 Tax=Pongo abelii TaxID=9601 RepID=A0A8I5U2E9_PONAB
FGPEPARGWWPWWGPASAHPVAFQTSGTAAHSPTCLLRSPPLPPALPTAWCIPLPCPLPEASEPFFPCRSPGSGLYSNLQRYDLPYPEAIFELPFFFHNPKPFFTLAKELYPGNYKPNVTHYFLRLLHDKGLLLRLYTQNIDGLERVSGIPASKLVEAHGTFASATCTVCQRPFPGEDIRADVMADRVPRCPVCTGVVKPDIVFFGEPLPQRFLLHVVDFPMADLLLILGTSLEVEPFASLTEAVRSSVPRLLINRDLVGPLAWHPRSRDVAQLGDVVHGVERLGSFWAGQKRCGTLCSGKLGSLMDQTNRMMAAPTQ